MPKLYERTFPLSSNVQKLKYDPDKKTLIVTFTNGSRYKYLDVSESVYDEACQAKSIGSFINQFVKNSYQYEKI